MLRFYFFVLIEYVIHLFGCHRKKPFGSPKIRSQVFSNEVLVHTHEWGGYPFSREKKIKYTNNSFVCGLKFSFERLTAYGGEFVLRKILTVSDCEESYLSKLKNEEFYDSSFAIYSIPNRGMDFGGYNFISQNCLMDYNQYVFLTNTSINADSIFFIDEYIEIFKKNPKLGLLGISYSSKIYQTLVRTNFTPHVQSFFVLTTSDIIKEVMSNNNGIFPGSNYNYKLSIIRFGEVNLSQIVKRLGYELGVVNELGCLQILPNIQDNSLVDGDYRLYVNHPNKINKFNRL